MAASIIVMGIAGLAYLQPNLAIATGPKASLAVGNLYRLVSVNFVNPSTGWVLAESADHKIVILRTTNAGDDWSRQLEAPAGMLSEYFHFFDTSNGVLAVLGPAAMILKSRDAGVSWQPTAMPGDGAHPVSVISAAFADPLVGWLLADVAGSQQLFRTTDGGQKWSSLGSPVLATDTAYQVVFGDRDRGWLYARSIGAYAYHTEDGGATWMRAMLPAPSGGWPAAPAGAALPEQFFVTARPTHGDGVVASVIPFAPPQGRSGGGGTITGYPPLKVHRFDGGRDVTYVYRTAGDTIPSRFSGLGSTAKPGPVITAEAEGEVQLSSVDGGAMWQQISAPISGAIGFLDSANWWWIGSGAWSRTSDGGRTWTKVRTIGVPEPLPGSLQLLDESHAWFGAMAGTRPLLEATTDAGLHWTMAFLPEISPA